MNSNDLPLINYSDNINPKESSVRLDKNVAFNILEFRQYDQDASILKALLFYIAYNNQTDLFGYCALDPAQFSSLLKISLNRLFRMHPNPEFLKHHGAQDKLKLEQKHGRMSTYRTWSTYLENALYILNTKVIVKDYRYHEKDKIIIESKNFTFLEEIRFVLKKTGKTHKVIYYYKPSEKFEANLKQYFLDTKLNKFAALKRSSLDDAYLDLLNRINNASAKNLYSIFFNIDDFADILAIKPYSRFSMYKRKINEKFNKLCQVIDKDVEGLELTWIKGQDQKVAANPVISWSKPPKKAVDNKNETVFKNIFDTELVKSLVKRFFETQQKRISILNEDQKISAFYQWFFSYDDLDIKEIVFKATYIEVYKNTKFLKKELERFNKMLLHMCKNQEKHKMIGSTAEGKVYLRVNDRKIMFDFLYDLFNYYQEKYVAK